jgi:hypothetical protein
LPTAHRVEVYRQIFFFFFGRKSVCFQTKPSGHQPPHANLKDAQTWNSQ